MRGEHRGGHHISAVVDHFLPAGRADAGCCPAPAGAQPPYRFAVAAPERGLLAAFACARLALASLPSGGGPSPVRVRIEEWHRQPWSAAPFLGGADTERLLSLFESRALPAAGVPRRLGGIELAAPGSAGAAGGPDDRGGTTVTWLNIGRLSAGSLAALEAARARSGGPALAPPLDGLIWCLTAAETRRMDGAYRLGRLLAALAPAQAKLLLFSADWAGPGGAGAEVREGAGAGATAAGSGPGEGGRSAAERPGSCAAWTAAAAGDRPLELVSVGGGPEWMESAVAEPAAARDRLFRRVVTSLELGAAALRRAAGRMVSEATASAGPDAAASPGVPEAGREACT